MIVLLNYFEDTFFDTLTILIVLSSIADAVWMTVYEDVVTIKFIKDL